MDTLKKGWFSEVNDLWPGVCLSFEIDSILHKEKSKYQNIMVMQTKNHGRALVTDDIIQIMEDDEFTYNEMLTFLPLCSHPNPKKVLIIGGGSGGGVRQVVKHPTVEVVDLVEIDGRVLDVCKQFFPSMTAVYKEPKVNVRVEDGLEYLKRSENKYDVIITDASEPIGPSSWLYRKDYFNLMKKALQPGGVISIQAGSLWHSSNHGERFDQTSFAHKCCVEVFGNAAYAIVSVPSFASGQIGIEVATTNMDVDLKKPVFVLDESFLEKMNLRYYSPSVHSAAFAIPRCFKKIFE